jgi:hypothetical protein
VALTGGGVALRTTTVAVSVTLRSLLSRPTTRYEPGVLDLKTPAESMAAAPLTAQMADVETAADVGVETVAVNVRLSSMPTSAFRGEMVREGAVNAPLLAGGPKV